MMKKAGEGSLATKVSRVLFNYRITPQSTTGLSPAEMLQGRKLRSTLDLLHPDRRVKVERKQLSQKKHHDKQQKGRGFQEGDAVVTRNFSHGPKWIPGFITKITGPVSYKVMLGDGNIVRRHVDQILSRPEKGDCLEAKVTEPLGLSVSPTAVRDASETSTLAGNGSVQETHPQSVLSPAPDKATPSVSDIPPPDAAGLSQPVVAPVRRSQRTVCKPSYLNDYEG